MMVAIQDSPNTVNTIEDIIRILRENPEAREAVRREILTDEILELPGMVAELVTLQKQMLERQDRQDARLDKQDARLDKQDARLDRMETTQKKILDTLDDHGKQLADHGRQLSNLNGWATMLAAERRFALLAIEMGLVEPRMLPIEDIALMSVSDKASEYTQSDLNSFRDCDIIIAARNRDGEACYVTVQVATTVDHGDISRSIDHAKMVTHFTGQPAYPAVAGFDAVPLAERRLAGDSIHWHRMRPRDRNPR